MLLDFTGKIPIISTEACFSSIVVRVRAVEKNDFSVWHMAGDHLEKKNATLIMTSFGPEKEYPEGRDQRICDFLIRPYTTSARPVSPVLPNEIHSFRVLSAIPAEDHPWTVVERWLLLGLGIIPRLRVANAMIFDLPSYRTSSTILPDPPFKIPTPPEVRTFWDRIASD